MKVQPNLPHRIGLVKRNNQKGFTQVELLIVIIITGVIPAIATPVLVNHYDYQQISRSSRS